VKTTAARTGRVAWLLGGGDAGFTAFAADFTA
jgi:hypothetical protein